MLGEGAFFSANTGPKKAAWTEGSGGQNRPVVRRDSRFRQAHGMSQGTFHHCGQMALEDREKEVELVVCSGTQK